MSGQSVSLGTIKTKVQIITSNVETDTAIPTGAVFAEVLLIGGGGGGGNGSASSYGGGGGGGAIGWYRFPVIAGTTKYRCTIGNGGSAGLPGGDTLFYIKGGPVEVTLTANNGVQGSTATTSNGGGGGGGAADTTTSLLLFQSVAGDSGTTGAGGGGTGGGLGGANILTTTPGTTNTGGGGGGGLINTAGKDGGSGYIQITWYFNTNSIVKLSEVDSQSYLFTSTATGYNLPAPLGAQAADVILIGGGGSGGSYTATNGGSGGGQGVISYSPIVIPQGSAVQIIEVKTNSASNPWYASPPTWEKNAPTTGKDVYWIWPQVYANVGATEGAYFVFYGIYNNTSTTSTSAYLSFGADAYGSVILNGSTVISWDNGNAGFSNPSITLLPGNNTFIITTINTDGVGATWLAATSASAGGGTVYYQTDNNWKWTMMYGITVGAGATTAATNGGDTTFTLNNMADVSSTAITLPNTTILTQFIAGGGVKGVNSSTAVVNSGTATIKKNTVTVGSAATPNDTNTNTTGNGMIMYVSGARGAAGSASGANRLGGNGGSFTGGTGGSSTVAPIAGQTNGGGGGGGAGSKTGSTTGANGGDGLALVTFYGGSISLPLSLYAVSTRTDIYTTGSSPAGGISIPTGAYILKLILIGGGGNGGDATNVNYTGGGGSGGLGMWIIPVAGITGTYSYVVGSPGTNTSFTINSIAFTANTGTNCTANSRTGGGGASAPTSPDKAVNMVISLAGVNGGTGVSSSTSGNGGGLYGGQGSETDGIAGGNGGIGSGGGGTITGSVVPTVPGGTGGNGLIVATWYYKNPNISLTNYINGPGGYSIYSNYIAGTYTVRVPAGATSFSAYIIGGQGGGSGGAYRVTSPSSAGGGGGSGGTSGYLYVSGISYTAGKSISITVGVGGTGGGTGCVGGTIGGTTSLNYDGNTFSCTGGGDAPTFGSSQRSSSGGPKGILNSTFSYPASGFTVTATNGVDGIVGGTNSTNGGTGGAGSITSITYSDNTTKSFTSGAGGHGEASTGGFLNVTAGGTGNDGGIYIIFS